MGERFIKQSIKKLKVRTSLVVQWIQTHLPMQRTQAPPLVQEDSTWPRATEPTCCNYWA